MKVAPGRYIIWVISKCRGTPKSFKLNMTTCSGDLTSCAIHQLSRSDPWDVFCDGRTSTWTDRLNDVNTRRHQFLPIVKCISMNMIVSIQQVRHVLNYTFSYVTYVPHDGIIVCECLVPAHHNSRRKSFFYVHWLLIGWIQRTILCQTRCYYIVLSKHKS